MAEEKARVLVVDDDPDLLDLVQRSLSAYGFEVLTHTSALGVSNLVRSSEPDFVLIDVNFPALKGDKVVNLARQYAASKTKFILYSASDESKRRSLALASGADGYISKSVQGEDLAHKLTAIHQKGRTAEPVPAAAR
jgi:two-component system, OmpR family, response regulator